MTRADLFSVEDKIAVVTGASSGIGKALAEGLAAHGSRVLLVARREAELDRAVAAIRERGGRARYLARSLDSEASVTAVVRACQNHYGDADILVNAAGINRRQPPEAVTGESWDETHSINLKIPFFLARAFVPAMKEKGWGKIINISSLQSQRAFEDGLAYGASKGGVAQLTRAMAEAWSRFGIGCNAIAPGFFPSELTEAVFSNETLARRHAEQTCIGRNGKLDDLLGAALFFSSEASDYVTGQTLFVDGGYSAK